jgi:hypothetical protein
LSSLKAVLAASQRGRGALVVWPNQISSGKTAEPLLFFMLCRPCILSTEN